MTQTHMAQGKIQRVKVSTDPRNDPAMGRVPVTVSPDLSWQVLLGNLTIEVISVLQGDLLRAPANSFPSLGGKAQHQFTSLHLEIPPVLSEPAVQQDWIRCWFWEGQPGGTST